MKRRHFLATTLATTLSSIAAEGRKPVVVLRSSWQTINIGDIGHTPGVLALLEKHLPDVEVRLWPSNVGRGVKEMLQKRFPNLKIVQSKEDVKTLFKEAHFLLHGSGPFLVAERDLKRWREETGKPYGVYGITLTTTTPSVKDHLNHAQFVYFRDSVSLAQTKADGLACPVMEFGPDGAFGCDLRDDEKAETFLKAHDLEEGQFVCCIPRLRHTPEWRVKDKDIDPIKHARNEKMAEHDHAPLRDAITAVVRETSLKVLLCPEDMTQMAVGKRWILDKLPADVQKEVVWRETFWLTDEALSTYSKSAGVFGLEMHSPIMCIGNGIPAIVCRFQEQTSKGFMWRDIGLNDWLFDFDREEDLQKLTPAVIAMIRNKHSTKSKIAMALATVHSHQQRSMSHLGSVLSPLPTS
ncbi:polysaccharide pyruvyl transferase family protein [Verrucomicrobiaceae bacterium 227]